VGGGLALVPPELDDLGIDRCDLVVAGNAHAVVAVHHEVLITDLVEAYGG
jgi:hypothetical protein